MRLLERIRGSHASMPHNGMHTVDAPRSLAARAVRDANADQAASDVAERKRASIAFAARFLMGGIRETIAPADARRLEADGVRAIASPVGHGVRMLGHAAAIARPHRVAVLRAQLLEARAADHPARHARRARCVLAGARQQPMWAGPPACADMGQVPVQMWGRCATAANAAVLR